MCVCMCVHAMKWPLTDLWTSFSNPLFPYSKDRFASCQQYTILLYKIHEIWNYVKAGSIITQVTTQTKTFKTSLEPTLKYVV